MNQSLNDRKRWAIIDIDSRVATVECLFGVLCITFHQSYLRPSENRTLPVAVALGQNQSQSSLPQQLGHTSWLALPDSILCQHTVSKQLIFVIALHLGSYHLTQSKIDSRLKEMLNPLILPFFTFSLLYFLTFLYLFFFVLACFFWLFLFLLLFSDYCFISGVIFSNWPAFSSGLRWRSFRMRSRVGLWWRFEWKARKMSSVRVHGPTKWNHKPNFGCSNSWDVILRLSISGSRCCWNSRNNLLVWLNDWIWRVENCEKDLE